MNGAHFFSSRRKFLVYLITEGKATAENFAAAKLKILETIETAVSRKIGLVQIREKNLPALLVFELARQAVRIAAKSETKILINDRADIALAARADGVHLTTRSLSADIIRNNFPHDFIVGVSTHSTAEAETARRQGANFVTFSPIFPTPDKEKYGASPQGLEKLRAVCEALKPFPVLALGGIDAENYKSALENGARGFAAIRFLNDAKNLIKISAPAKTES